MSTDQVPEWAKEALAAIAEANENKTKCTCKEYSKQRALCPVCDKEEYDKMKHTNAGELKKIHPAMLEDTAKSAFDFFEEAFKKQVFDHPVTPSAIPDTASPVTITITKADHYTDGEYDMGNTNREEVDNPDSLW